MIVKYPTGFYKEVLPSSPSDGGNVTYTISTTDPPRSNLSFQKIPSGIKFKKNVVKSPDRLDYGQLAISFSTADATALNDNSAVYQIGQVLEFNQFSTRKIDPLLVTDNIEERHDLLAYDYQEMGLDLNDQKAIVDYSTSKLNELQGLLNVALAERKNAEIEISTTQKRINDIDRNLDALSLLDQDNEILSIISKLQSTKSQLEQQRLAAQNTANNAASQALSLRNSIRTLSTVVR